MHIREIQTKLEIFEDPDKKINMSMSKSRPSQFKQLKKDYRPIWINWQVHFQIPTINIHDTHKILHRMPWYKYFQNVM